MTRAHFCGALLALATLSGCVETRFESPPGDNIETCDARWKGLWTGSSGKDDSATAFFVDEGCRFDVLDQPEKGGAFKDIHVPVNFVHVNGRDFIVVPDTAIRGLVKLPPVYGITPAPAKSFFITRYHFRDESANALDVFPVDDQRVAQDVIAGKYEGTVTKTASELHVFVRGDRARTLEMIRRDPIFVDKPTLTLTRINQSVSDYERDTIAAQRRSKKP